MSAIPRDEGVIEGNMTRLTMAIFVIERTLQCTPYFVVLTSYVVWSCRVNIMNSTHGLILENNHIQCINLNLYA